MGEPPLADPRPGAGRGFPAASVARLPDALPCAETGGSALSPTSPTPRLMRPERFRRLREVLARRQPDLTVLMDRVDKAHNFSAILRSCDAVGALEAHAVAAEPGLEVHHATSAGTKKWVSVQRHADVEAAIAHLRGLGFRILAAHPSPSALDYRKADYTRPVAITLGAELEGVSTKALELADAQVMIPMMGMVHSLNVSVASALLLFEAQRQRAAAGMYDESRLDPEAFAKRLFEWAYPTLARSRLEQSLPYPALDDDGQIVSTQTSSRPSWKRSDSSTPS